MALFFTSEQYHIPLFASMEQADPWLLRTITLCMHVRRVLLTDNLQRTAADWELYYWVTGID